MAPRRKSATTKGFRSRRPNRSRQAPLGFEALTIEGGLLSPDWLHRIAAREADHQDEADYRIPKGLQLRDEISRYWRIAQAHWGDLAVGRRAMTKPEGGRALAERFVLALLRQCLGFDSLIPVEAVVLSERRYPLPFAALEGRVPVVIAPVPMEGMPSDLDSPSPQFGDAFRKRSAFGLAQEYLNSADLATWGLVSDGLTLRILRDNASLTRPAWIEVDLARIFTEGLFSSFTALWLLAHETRFGRVGDTEAAGCVLETWREKGREEGTRAREDLRRGVEDALVELGRGFLAHAENGALRQALQAGALTPVAYFQELLRLVYRVIFLLTVEERGLLHLPTATEEARVLYAEGYSLRRLRDRALRRSAHDRYSDLWEAAKVVFRGVATGEPRLGLPALAGIFSVSQTPWLDAAKLENRALLLAVYRLAWLRRDTGVARVNWRDMGPEELGSVYESLLELVPQVIDDARSFCFATGGETKGNARKMSGSYYTPDSLVQVLLDSALEPVVANALAANPDRAVAAILELTVVDPACGSGHFLLAAARRLAAHVARTEANGTPSAAEYRKALRSVVGKCLYGVDLNPMAVELCKVGLWMEAVEPGLPLTFLDAHIRQGNALLGTTPELMKGGIPDAAWEPIEGDDRKVASALKKHNKKSDQGQRALPLQFLQPTEAEAAAVARAVAEVEAAPDADLRALEEKGQRWEKHLESEAYRHQKLVADAWCAAFVWPKQPGPLQLAAPTNDVWLQLRDRVGEPNLLTVKTTEELADQYQFFHWHLAFPQVFERGGFDVVLGNPPWDSLLFREEEFFSASRPEIAAAPTAAVRKKLVAQLVDEAPALHAAYQAALRRVGGFNAFVRSGPTFPLCGVGRVNLFALFAEAARRFVAPSGRVGQILQSGIVTDDSTKLFFRTMVERRQLISFVDFENREKIFPAIDSRISFGIMTSAGDGDPGRVARFLFSAKSVADLRDAERWFNLSSDDIAALNPATRTCPVFRSGRDAKLAKDIYVRLRVLGWNSGWLLELRRFLNSADDSSAFSSKCDPVLLPLYEGKYFHHFDHRWMTTAGGLERELSQAEKADPDRSVLTKFRYPVEDIARRFGRFWARPWVLAWRDIARSTDERTFISAVVPSLAITDTAKVILLNESQLPYIATIIAQFSSFVFDYASRQKIGGTHMSSYIVGQLPSVSFQRASLPARWTPNLPLNEWLHLRVLELTYTAWDLEAFAGDIGYAGPPYRWDPERRFLLRSEIDAAFFHLYELSRDDSEYVLDTFPIVAKSDAKAHGEYRTKRVILEIYDEMAEAAQAGQSYVSRLDPPPADPRVAHPPRIAKLGPVPEWVSVLEPAERAAYFILALVDANGGSISQTEVARAYLLASEPNRLLQFAPDELAVIAREWANKVTGKALPATFWRSTLLQLRERAALDFLVDSSGYPAYELRSAGKEVLGKLDKPWVSFEALLALRVLRSLPEVRCGAVDANFSAQEKTWLAEVS